MQIAYKNKIFTGADKKQSLYDLSIPESWNNKLIVFIHGYMGYKDWGCWNLVSEFFTNEGYGFLKYNVSHNGGTIQNPIDFDDLDSFAHNNYTKELQDFEAITRVIEQDLKTVPDLFVIGHSRGGGIALLHSDNGFVKKIATWAAIAGIEHRFPRDKELAAWQKDGYYFKKNGRTNQQMPHHYSQYENFLKHKDRLDIRTYCLNSTKPTIVIHGALDTSVALDEGRLLANWLQTELSIIEGTQHTFGSSQPWEKNQMPAPLKEACERTLNFFQENVANDTIQKREKLSLISELIKLAKSDQEIRQEEFNFLLSVASQLGIEKKDFERLFETYIAFHPPKFELDRIVQFQRLVLLMNIDSQIDDQELNFIRDLGIRMGLNPNATREILTRMYERNNRVIPPEELLNIFNTFNN